MTRQPFRSFQSWRPSRLYYTLVAAHLAAPLAPQLAAKQGWTEPRLFSKKVRLKKSSTIFIGNCERKSRILDFFLLFFARRVFPFFFQHLLKFRQNFMKIATKCAQTS
jgi:hypothetical protein